MNVQERHWKYLIAQLLEDLGKIPDAFNLPRQLGFYIEALK